LFLRFVEKQQARGGALVTTIMVICDHDDEQRKRQSRQVDPIENDHGEPGNDKPNEATTVRHEASEKNTKTEA
jgi:hypothetical protein